MEVILLEKIRNLGALGDKVKVKPGFARNFLIPQGKAVYANKENTARFEKQRAELEKLAASKHQKTLERQQQLNDLPIVVITAKAGEEGKLFGSVGTRDIAEAISKTGTQVAKKEIRLSEGTIRKVGEYEVLVDLESDLTATVKISIVAEG